MMRDMVAALATAEAQLEDLRDFLDRCRGLLPSITAAGDEIRTTLRTGGKLLTAGNGGVAADSLHLAEELVGCYDKERLVYRRSASARTRHC